MDGGSLYNHLQFSIDISWRARVSLLEQAAMAINFLHTGNPQIFHRDIKSPNFLITKDTLELKLTDFGTSKIVSVATATTSTLGSIVGSHRWAAPETTAVEPNWTDKADIYSLGMTFYEIVTGKIPFDQITENNQVIFLVKDKQRPPIPRDCPKDITALITRCWDNDPSVRPSSQEVLKALDKISNAIAAAPPSPAQKGRCFYEVNEELLLSKVPPECITVLKEPPPFPGTAEEKAKLQLPSEVKVVVLKQSKISPLLSSTYEVQLFQRVEVFFRRFFTPHDVTMKVTLDQVDVVLNPLIEQRFKEAEEKLHTTLKGVDELKDKDQSDLQRDYLNNLLMSENLVKTRNSNPVSVWHGANSNKIESIQWYGMLNLSNNDPGYYGKGIYFTQCPKYGEYYVEKLEEKTEGRFKLILCWALLGRPWAVTKVNLGAPCKPSYTSHFTVVTKKKLEENICELPSDFESLEGLENYFPVLKGEAMKGDEIALFDSSHVLPRFIVHYTVEKNRETFQGAEQRYSLPRPITGGISGGSGAKGPKPKASIKKAEAKESQQTLAPFTQAGMVSTLAGSYKGMKDGTKEGAKFNHPNGLCFSPVDKCLYVCDTDNKAIRKITSQGVVSTLKFAAEEDAPVLKGPVGIAIFQKDKSIFIVDESLHTIFKVSAAGRIGVFAGRNGRRGNKDGMGSNASFTLPWCIAIDQESGDVYIGDKGNHVIRMINQQGLVTTVCGSGARGFEDGAATVAKFADIRGIVFHPLEKALFVCDNGNRRVRKISLVSGLVSTVCSKLNGRALAITSNNGSFLLFVATIDQIFKLTTTNNPDKVVIAGQYTVLPQCVDGPALDCRFGDIHGLAIDEESKVCFIADHYHAKIRKLTFA